MAQLFSTFAQFKAQIGGAINTSVDLESLAPVIEDAARTHLVPFLGQSFYDALVAGIAGTPTVAQTALVPFVRKALAKLTMFEYLKTSNVQFGESGLHRIENENRKSAYRYQEREYSDYQLTSGYNDIETMLKFLSDNQAQYPTWVSTDEAQMHLNSLCNYAAQVRVTVQRQCDRFTFETLRPAMSAATEFGIKKLIPVALYNDLLTKYKASTLSTLEKNVVLMIRAAVFNTAISHAITEGWIKYDKGTIVVHELFGEQSSINKTSPQASLSMVVWQNEINALRYNELLNMYIRDNKASFLIAFDTASGGSNTSADAWHIDTAAEASAKADLQADNRKKGIVAL